MVSLNWIDNVILLVFLISILVGLMRGLVKELIGVITWAAAFTIGILFSPKLANFFNNYHATSGASDSVPSTISIGTSFIILFIATIIVGSIINYFVSRAVEMGGISFSNRLLGAVFGLARGFLLVIFAIYIAQMTPLAEKTYWAESQFVHSFQPAVVWINQTLAADIESIKSKMGDTLKDVQTHRTKESTN